MNWNKIIECVPNFSEGRDLEKIDKIVAPFRGKSGVKLLDYSNDEDHNRLVVTLVGEPEALRDAVIEAIRIAVRLIDLNHHSGQHPAWERWTWFLSFRSRIRRWKKPSPCRKK